MDNNGQNNDDLRFFSTDEINQMFKDVVEIEENKVTKVAYSCAVTCGTSPSGK